MRQRGLSDGLSSFCCGYQLTAMDSGKSRGSEADFSRSVTLSKSQLLRLFPISKVSKEHIIDLLSPKMLLLGPAQVSNLSPKHKQAGTVLKRALILKQLLRLALGIHEAALCKYTKVRW